MSGTGGLFDRAGKEAAGGIRARPGGADARAYGRELVEVGKGEGRATMFDVARAALRSDGSKGFNLK